MTERPWQDAPLEVYDALCTLQVVVGNALEDVPSNTPQWGTLDAMDAVLAGLEMMAKPTLAILGSKLSEVSDD